MTILRLASVLLVVSACSHAGLAPVKAGGKTLPGGLALASHDTPYFMTTVDTMPESATKVIIERAAEAFQGQEAILTGLSDLDAKQKKLIKLVMRKSAELYAEGGAAKFGLTHQANIVAYGLGIRPVVRVQLANVKRFDALLLDMLSQAEVTWEASTVDGQVVRHIRTFAGKMAKASILQFYHHNDLVITVVRPGETKALMPWLTGTKRPQKSLATSARLSQLVANSNSARTRYMVGELSAPRLIALLAFDTTETPNLLAEARDDKKFMKTSRHALRLVGSLFGPSQFIAEVDDKLRFVTTMKQHAAPALAPYLDKLAAAVPSQPHGEKNLVSFTLGMNLANLESLLSSGLQAHLEQAAKAGMKTTKPKRQRAHHQEAFAKRGLDAPPPASATPPTMVEKPIIDTMKPGTIPPFAKAIHGLSISLLGLNLENPSPLSMLGSLRLGVVVGTDNPGALIAMAMRHPRLGALLQGLEIPADSKPVSLDGRAPLPGLSVLRSDKALALAFGGGVAEQVSGWLTAKPLADPALLHSNVDGPFVGRVMRLAAKQMSARSSKFPKAILSTFENSAKQLENTGLIRYSLRVVNSVLVFEGEQTLAAAPAND